MSAGLKCISHFFKIHINTVDSSTPRSPKWSLFLRFPHQNPVHASPTHHMRYMLYPSYSSRFDHTNNTGWGVQIIKLLIMKFPPLSCYLIPHRHEYSPQYPMLKHFQPTFLPQCEWPSFTPIHNNMQNCSSMFLNFYIFGYQSVRQKTQHQMIASIPWLQCVFNFFLNSILICSQKF